MTTVTRQHGSGKDAGQVTLGREQRKLTKGEAGFQERGGIPELRCGDCHFFTGEACRIVEGEIDHDDVCNQFDPALEKGNVSSATVVASEQLPHLDMYVYRVSENPQTGVRRWFATASGTKVDKYNERMSVPLFKDFIKRAESREPAPEPFASKAWMGGLPYLGIAHYLDLDGYGIIGPTDRIWVDGDIFKAKGTFRNTPLANRVYDAIKADIERNVGQDERVRISIAFIDWEHEHEGRGVFRRKSLSHSCAMCQAAVGNKVYRRGQLVHLATTRRPAYEETEIALEERSTMTTKRDDAASIVGDDEAEKLHRLEMESLTRRSDGPEIAPGAVVVKQEEDKSDPSGTASTRPEEDEPMTERMTLGGAVTLDEAEKALSERADETAYVDEWDVLGVVLTNIAGEDKAEQVKSVLSDFQTSVDVMAAKAVIQIGDMLARESGDDGEAASAQAADSPPVERTEELEVEDMAEHPLDDALAVLREAYDEALETPLDRASRLAMIQPALMTVGEAIRKSVTEPSAPSNAAGVDAESLASMIQQALAPLEAKVEALGTANVVERKAALNLIPGPRNLRTRTQPVLPAPAGETPKPKSKLTMMIRKSVGLQD